MDNFTYSLHLSLFSNLYSDTSQFASQSHLDCFVVDAINIKVGACDASHKERFYVELKPCQKNII